MGAPYVFVRSSPDIWAEYFKLTVRVTTSGRRAILNTLLLFVGRSAAQACRIAFSFEFVGELIELVEINSKPESKRMWNDLRHRFPTWLCLFAETGTERPIDHIVERQPEFARSPLQDVRQIIINGEPDAHEGHE